MEANTFRSGEMEKYFLRAWRRERERDCELRTRPSSLGGIREKSPREGKSRSRSNINRAFRRINWQRPFYSSRPTGICPRSRYTNTLPLHPFLPFFLPVETTQFHRIVAQRSVSRARVYRLEICKNTTNQARSRERILGDQPRESQPCKRFRWFGPRGAWHRGEEQSSGWTVANNLINDRIGESLLRSNPVMASHYSPSRVFVEG